MGEGRACKGVKNLGIRPGRDTFPGRILLLPTRQLSEILVVNCLVDPVELLIPPGVEYGNIIVNMMLDSRCGSRHRGHAHVGAYIRDTLRLGEKVEEFRSVEDFAFPVPEPF